jgi:type III restriction enzyme
MPFSPRWPASIRRRLAEWRQRDYAGANRVAKKLLRLWRGADRRQPLFFA